MTGVNERSQQRGSLKDEVYINALSWCVLIASLLFSYFINSYS
ncbi:hypothetical protein HMPREF0208_00597 [Citrobacter koseri]|uniref:Uncharacterized protein n=1 Tax=Citrobacter koseri (strain ATCC BAA-895 / CDC 4225-83 / SGSC4696) TaxID=290338 RepID=A8AKL4_CITK8|nr:hypothetical protein CKO_02921 [Citrobacter koseri ATCC BAA-895]KWZ97546.1 hypothetical protein HMPREF3207_04471 [Citrobacter koseri]KXA01633.1 hypothetical protein HMPREF3220_01411 [Citrobacter koseri]KXB46711.1 hypothetical protein HMPREF0208_00597 [Citrobacter koseri]